MVDGIRAELLALGLGPSTATLYARTIRRAQAWCEGLGYDLATVPATVIVQWVQDQPRGHSNRKLLKTALSYYWEMVERQAKRPVLKVPPRPRMECRALEPDEAAHLGREAAARHDEPGLAVLCGLYLALRRMETAKLRWADFRPGYGELYVIGKRDVTAWVPVHPFLARYLESWPRSTPWVFPSPSGRRDHVCPATIWDWTLRVAREAGLGHVPPHMLRHTSLATANDATGDLRAVQHFARHTDPNITSGYTRVTGARLHAVVMSLNFAQPRSVRSERGSPTAEDDGGLRLAA